MPKKLDLIRLIPFSTRRYEMKYRMKQIIRRHRKNLPFWRVLLQLYVENAIIYIVSILQVRLPVVMPEMHLTGIVQSDMPVCCRNLPENNQKNLEDNMG